MCLRWRTPLGVSLRTAWLKRRRTNPLLSAGCEDGLHAVCRLALQRRQHVTVRVHCQADLTVTQRFHHHPRMNALDQEERCACVTEVVESHLRQAGLLE